MQLEVHEKREEEAKKEQGILGKIQGTINSAMYKSKYEDEKMRALLTQKTFNEQLFE